MNQVLFIYQLRIYQLQKYRVYVPWEYVDNSDNDAREFLIISIYKISYYLFAAAGCNGGLINDNFKNLIRHINSDTLGGSYSEVDKCK